MMKTGQVVAGMLVVLLAATPAWAKEGQGKDPQQHLDRMSKKLDLNSDQRSKVESIMKDYRGRIESLHEQIEALQKEKRERIKAVLSPEQQEKFEKMKHRKGSRGWFKKRGG